MGTVYRRQVKRNKTTCTYRNSRGSPAVFFNKTPDRAYSCDSRAPSFFGNRRPRCPRCRERLTMAHVLDGCQVHCKRQEIEQACHMTCALY
ncbi:hypothetical protein O3M35_002327 [Rhynocoris fuscipes]|uniref:Uncharacterized protein n=1 Tax=Rhynocoris fuscipes TaxID=488301 RepID=A0AAW1CJZ1_9HEMI